MDRPVPVTFEPLGTTVWVSPGLTVLAAARRAGILIPAPCGSRGICGGCGIRVLEGRLEDPDASEAHGLALAPPDVRLACKARVVEAVSVRPVVVQSTGVSGLRPASGDERRFVAAVDLGTTGVAAVIIDAATGAEVGRGHAPNHQASWGGDVLSRIEAAVSGAAADLQAAGEASVLAALGAACDDAGACLTRVERLVIAGNSTMSALLLGANVASLASHPFASPVSGSAELSPESSVSAALAQGAETLVVPALGGFVGGDAMAGLLATGLAETTKCGLLVDLGTNAEIVCATGSGLVGASAAAGPAFEGFGIRSGGPAVPGAIERVSYADGRLEVGVIGGARAGWFCGSGLVSAIALLRRLGHLDAEGAMHPEGPLQARFTHTADDVLAVDLSSDVDGGESGTGQGGAEPSGSEAAESKTRQDSGVLLTQQDVRAFQLAKGAVATAVDFVLRRAALAPVRVDDVLVAGAFGSALAVDDLLDTGVLPRGFGKALRVVGNASLAGAAMVALDPSLAEQTERMRQRFEHVDLAADPGFSEAFLGSFSLEPRD